MIIILKTFLNQGYNKTNEVFGSVITLGLKIVFTSNTYLEPENWPNTCILELVRP